MYDGFENAWDALARLRTDEERAGSVEPDRRFDLFAHPFGFRRGQVNLVDHRDDFQAVVESQVRVRQCLGLHPLGSIDDKQRSFARRQAS